MKKLVLLLVVIWTISSCDNDYLEPQIYSAIGPSNFWKNAADAEAGVLGLYSWLGATWGAGYHATGIPVRSDLTTGECKGVRNDYFLIENFQWNPSQNQNDFYNAPLQWAVRANSVIAKIEAIEDIDGQKKSELIAEARAVRAWYLSIIYDFYGPTVLETAASPDIDDQKQRASEEEYTTFLTKELEEAANDLPDNLPVGRISKGAALTQLMKVYMIMTRFVDKSYYKNVSEVAKKIMDLGIYSLQADYSNIWSLDNEGNSEVIYAISRLSTESGNSHLAHSLHYLYESAEGNPLQKWNVYRVPWAVYDSFEEGDKRRETLLAKFPARDENTGELYELDLREFEGGTSPGAIPFKYTEDPNINGFQTNHDIVVFRYADVLLIRAEALNELNGPNQESVDLVNMVRSRAGLGDIALSDFPSKSDMRARLLQERQWELFMEGVRRQDLIRHGLYIEKAFERGALGVPNVTATYLERWPIPQEVIDKNAKIKQNPGYN